MNYRHSFHAGNFADLVKHAALLATLAAIPRRQGPLTIVDTHAGAGRYDLADDAAKRSGEAAAGIGALMTAQDPSPGLLVLRAAVAAANAGGATRFYPGSPWLIAQAMKPGDTYLACELHPQEHAALQKLLAGRANVTALHGDGYDALGRHRLGRGPVLALIDPPFERPDDYQRATTTVAELVARRPDAVAMVWTPLKDLETFDGFLRGFTDLIDRPVTALEARMRPLTDPMRLNGCALVLVNAPPGVDQALASIGDWVTAALGQDGVARITKFG